MYEEGDSSLESHAFTYIFRSNRRVSIILHAGADGFKLFYSLSLRQNQIRRVSLALFIKENKI